MKHKTPLDFHLDCNCIPALLKASCQDGTEIRGLMYWVDKKGNIGVSLPVIKNIPLSKDFDVVSLLHFNFCPFCGKQIAVKLIRKASDETEPKAKPDA